MPFVESSSQLVAVRESKNFEQVVTGAKEKLEEWVGHSVQDQVFDAALGRIGLESLEGLGSNDRALAGFDYGQLEAIVLSELRPAYRYQNGSIDIAGNDVEGDPELTSLIEINRAAFEEISRGVGRVDLIGHPRHPYVGTGWLIDEDVVVTNRHVAEEFAQAAASGE